MNILRPSLWTIRSKNRAWVGTEIYNESYAGHRYKKISRDLMLAYACLAHTGFLKRTLLSTTCKLPDRESNGRCSEALELHMSCGILSWLIMDDSAGSHTCLSDSTGSDLTFLLMIFMTRFLYPNTTFDLYILY